MKLVGSDSQSSGEAGAEMTLIFHEVPGEAEIGDLWPEPLVQQDVAGLDVPVYDPDLRSAVQVREPLRRAQHDLEPPLPVQRGLLERVCIAISCHASKKCQSETQNPSKLHLHACCVTN